MQLSKHEQRALRAERNAKAFKGEGLYVYENKTGGDLMLPKPTASGQRKVAKGAKFQGDNYFMQLVKNNQCKLIQEIISPQQEQLMLENETNAKLLLDQPVTVTEAGQVEYIAPVVGGKKLTEKKLNEAPKPVDEPADKLINEDPIDGVNIILE